jgi:APA family basic amino acid/polyamine antiporter
MRKNFPKLHRPFRTPLVPVIPILGILVCLMMILALDLTTLTVAGIWMLAGLFIYFGYSRRHSLLNKQSDDSANDSNETKED